MQLPRRRVVLAASAVAAVALERYSPHWLLHQSKWQTTAALTFAYVVMRFLWSVFAWPLLFSPLRHLPQPGNNHWLLGQWLRIFAEPTGMPHREWMETIPNDGLLYYRGMFNSERLVATSPKALGEALTTRSYDLVKPTLLTQDLARILGVGVLLAEGDEHKRQRRNLLPAFAFRHIKDLYPVFWDLTRAMVRAVDHEVAADPSKPVRIDKWASRATLDIIGVAGMGQTFDAINDENSRLYAVYQSIFRDTPANRIIGLLGLLLPYWFVSRLPIKRNADLTNARAAIRDICHDLIRTKKAALKAADKNGENNAAGVDILAVALQSGAFDDDNLVDQLMTFLAAGHETVATAMSWAMLLLCQHPGVQTKLRAELAAADLPSIRDPSGTITADQLDRLPYLQACINEILRFHPPVPFTIRIAARDTSLLDQFVPKGTMVVFAPAATNHQKAFWGPDADEFKPERWMGPGRANNGGASSAYASMTFLHGPRSCIGMAFSKAEFASLVAGWVLAYDSALAEPERKIEIQGGVTQRIKGGLELVVKPLGV